MSFFYNLNKRLAELAAKQDAAQLAESKQAESVAKSPLTKALKEGIINESRGALKKIEKLFNRIYRYGDDGLDFLNDEAPVWTALFDQHDGDIQEIVRITPQADLLTAIEELTNVAEYLEAGLEEGRSTGDYSAKKARAGKDIGKPGKAFGKIAKSAGERYGSKAAGERVAGAVLNKLRHPSEGIENEGNAFTGALNATPKGGKFKVGGKEFTDTSSIEEADMTSLESEMTPKQKSFAKLAPPTDKITFADKIAGAKKEVDEMLGDVAAEAIKAAIGKGKKVVADEDGTPSSTGGTIHKTAKGLRHVAGKNYAGTDDDGDDDFDDDKPKTKGRPKGTGRAIGAKVKGTSKLHRQAAIAEEDIDEGYAEMDAWLKKREAEKGTGKFDVKDTGYSKRYTRRHEEEPESDDDVSDAPKKKGRPAGTKRAIGAKVKGTSKLHRQDAIAEEEHVCEMCGQPVAEKAVSKKQQKFMGMVHAAQKGEKPASKEVAKVAKEMPKKAAKDFAATKHKGLPEKVKSKKEVEETTTSGSVATAPASAPKSSKGMQFGKGVYESLDRQYKQALLEGMNVSVNLDSDAEGDAQKSITVTATGSDADKLAELLKMAGLEQKQSSCGCGTEPCSCDEELDENSPDWPTNDETLSAEPNLRTYSGGLNGPKSTGQTTTPVIASQLRRQASMEESVELERTLFKTWKNYKG